jgi:hypothetical protein
MNRREFLQSTSGAFLLALLPFGLFKKTPEVKPIKQKLTVLPADDPKRLRLGWMVYEEVGFAVINDHAINRIVVQ